MKKIKVTLSSAEIDLLDVLVQAECCRADSLLPPSRDVFSSLEDKIHAYQILLKCEKE